MSTWVAMGLFSRLVSDHKLTLPIQLIMKTARLVIYLKSYSEEPPRKASITGSEDSSVQNSSVLNDRLLPPAPKVVGSICLAHTLLVLAPTIALATSPWPRDVANQMALNFWTLFVGGISVVLAATQYCPQICLTFKLKNTGGLTIPAMCAQAPIFIILAASLAFRVTGILDFDANAVAKLTSRIAWLNYALGGCTLFVLLILSVHVNYVFPRLRNLNTEVRRAVNAPTPRNEETPLIEGELTDESHLSFTINKTMSGCR